MLLTPGLLFLPLGPLLGGGDYLLWLVAEVGSNLLVSLQYLLWGQYLLTVTSGMSGILGCFWAAPSTLLQVLFDLLGAWAGGV